MTPRHMSYALLLAVLLAAAIGGELRCEPFWQWPIFVTFAFISTGLLMATGALMRLPSSWQRGSVLGYCAVLVLLWYLPLNPVEAFVRDVERIQPGMTEEEVDTVMASQVKGAFLAGSDGRNLLVSQPFAGQTYYEPQRQRYSFDSYCLVSWQDGRVSGVKLHLD